MAQSRSGLHANILRRAKHYFRYAREKLPLDFGFSQEF